MFGETFRARFPRRNCSSNSAIRRFNASSLSFFLFCAISYRALRPSCEMRCSLARRIFKSLMRRSSRRRAWWKEKIKSKYWYKKQIVSLCSTLHHLKCLWDTYNKIKNFHDELLTHIVCVRTHPEELLLSRSVSLDSFHYILFCWISFIMQENVSCMGI